MVYVRNTLAKLSCDIYGLESMIYLTTGIIDQYDNPKVDMESAITKAYSQDILQKLTKFAMHLINSPVTITGHSIELNVQNAIQLLHNETSLALKNYVTTSCLQYAAVRYTINLYIFFEFNFFSSNFYY